MQSIYFEASWNDAPDGMAGPVTHYRAGRTYKVADDVAERAFAAGRAVAAGGTVSPPVRAVSSAPGGPAPEDED